MPSMYKTSFIKNDNHHLYNHIANIAVKGEMNDIRIKSFNGKNFKYDKSNLTIKTSERIY